MSIIILDDAKQEFTVKSTFIPVFQEFIERCRLDGAILENTDCIINTYQNNY